MSESWSEIVSTESLVKWLTTSGLRVVLILVGALIAVRLATFITRRVENAFEDNDPSTMNEREKQAATLGKVIRNLTRILVWGVAVMMVLKELGIDIGPILAGVGLMGLAVGFGAQSLVKDFLAGMFVLIENQYNVGDVIRAAGATGAVEKITLRATTLRDLGGDVHIIPNGAIDVVTNKTRQWSRFVLDVGVAYKESELGADPKFASMITAPLEVLGVQDFADSAVIIRVMFTTQPVKQWTVGREFRRRVKNTFDAKGIEIPFPHTTIYLGDAAPMNGMMRVKVERDDA
jgi:small conductance mechanosensitive channel